MKDFSSDVATWHGLFPTMWTLIYLEIQEKGLQLTFIRTYPLAVLCLSQSLLIGFELCRKFEKHLLSKRWLSTEH
jgi:hypothetical protein